MPDDDPFDLDDSTTDPDFAAAARWLARQVEKHNPHGEDTVAVAISALALHVEFCQGSAVLMLNADGARNLANQLLAGVAAAETREEMDAAVEFADLDAAGKKLN